MTTRAILLAAADDWLARDDIASDANAGLMLTLAEAQINRDVRCRAQETTTTLVCSSRYTALPARFLSFRFATLQSSLGRRIDYLTPERLRASAIWQNQGGGYSDEEAAQAMTIEGASDDDGDGSDSDGFFNVVLAPEPNAGSPVTLDIGYFAAFAPLSDDSDTNWLLQNNFDIYLWQYLRQVAIWDDDEALETQYETRYDKALHKLETQENRARMPAAKGLVSTGSPRAIV